MFTRHGLVSLHVHVQSKLHCFIAHNDLCLAVWWLPDVPRHPAPMVGWECCCYRPAGLFAGLRDALEVLYVLFVTCSFFLGKRMGSRAARHALLTMGHLL